jgi:hypothetical protein
MKTVNRMCGYALVCLAAVLLPGHALGATPAKVLVGIFPTYDQAGESFGQVFAQHLTAMIYRGLEGSAVDPRLLNPGGLYTPVLDDFTTEYAEKSEIDVALVTVLLKTEIPKKGDATLQVKSDLVDFKSGKTLASWLSSEQINRHELFVEHGSIEFFISSHPFQKQPLGKAAHKISEDIRAQVTRAAASVTTTRAAQAPSSGPTTCNAKFNVAYVSKHASSKSYDAIVNGKNETLGVVDGNLPLALQSGPLFIQLAVHDSPYKLPKQEIYQVNTQVDCSQEAHTLSFEIGAAGEGFLKWQ